jgi:rRNA maturation endonuclease Nob1
MMETPPFPILIQSIFATLFVLLLLVLFYNQRRYAWKPKRRKEKIYRCAGCGRIYSDRRNVPLSTCPECNQLNEAARR